MTIHGYGASMLAILMRAERARDLDTSWLLFGPEGEEADLETDDAVEPWRHAAE